MYNEVAESAYRLLLGLSLLVEIFFFDNVVTIFSPFIGRSLAFIHMCWLYAFFSFEYVQWFLALHCVFFLLFMDYVFLHYVSCVRLCVVHCAAHCCVLFCVCVFCCVVVLCCGVAVLMLCLCCVLCDVTLCVCCVKWSGSRCFVVTLF
jgi:hypothetical protein